jgi:AcrR family transcriptional regulator
MSAKQSDARNRILAATLDLLDEQPDADQITVREIAARADVGIGSINYHFQSRDNLIRSALASTVEAIDPLWKMPEDMDEEGAFDSLRSLLKVNADVGFSNLRASRILISHLLLQGENDVPYVILPLLEEIFGKARNERELKLLAMALVVTLQVGFIRPEAFRRYLGVDITDKNKRDDIIDMFVDVILKK